MTGVIDRLRYLRSREALAAVVLPAVIIWKWRVNGGEIAWGIRLAALSLLVYILVQGTLYWHLKLRAISGEASFPTWFYRLFRSFKWSNCIAIVCMVAVLGQGSLSEADMRWSIGLLLGAVLEQINYYHYQLMYDTRAAFDHLRRHGRLRKAALGIDIARAATRTL